MTSEEINNKTLDLTNNTLEIEKTDNLKQGKAYIKDNCNTSNYKKILKNKSDVNIDSNTVNNKNKILDSFRQNRLLAKNSTLYLTGIASIKSHLNNNSPNNTKEKKSNFNKTSNVINYKIPLIKPKLKIKENELPTTRSNFVLEPSTYQNDQNNYNKNIVNFESKTDVHKSLFKEEYDKIKLKFIDYILHKSVCHADINQVENEYIEKNKQLNYKQNELKDAIAKKEKILKDVDDAIYKELSHIKNNSNNFITNKYNNSTKYLNKKIKEEIYNYNSYLKILQRSKSEHFKLKYDLTKSTSEIKLVDKQFNRFLILKNNITSLLNIEEKTYNDLQEYNKINNYHNIEVFKFKKKYFNSLEYKLHEAIDLTKKGEFELSIIKNKKLTLKNIYNKTSLDVNNKIININIIKKSIIKQIIFIEKLKENLNIKDIEELFKHYNVEETNLNKNKNVFIAKNLDLKLLCEEYRNLENQIKREKKKSVKLNIYNNNVIEEFMLQDENYIYLTTKLKRLIYYNKNKNNLCLKYNNFLKTIDKFIYDNLFKLSEIKKTFYYNEKGDKYKIASRLSFYNEKINILNNIKNNKKYRESKLNNLGFDAINIKDSLKKMSQKMNCKPSFNYINRDIVECFDKNECMFFFYFIYTYL